MNRNSKGLGFSSVLFLAFSATNTAAQQDCFGYTVPSNMEKKADSLFFKALAEKDSIPFYIDFWVISDLIPPDSCDVLKRNCPDSVMTRAKKVYDRWGQHLVNNYTLFKQPDLTEPITSPDPRFWPEVYNPLFAPESTVMALYKECYVWRVGYATVPANVIHSSGSRIRPEGVGIRYNAMGRRLPSGKKPEIPGPTLAIPPVKP